MNSLNCTQKSNASSLFASVFKREDIHNRIGSQERQSHFRSASQKIERSEKGYIDEGYNTGFSDNVMKVEVSGYSTKENFSRFNVKDDFEYNNEMKYNDLAKRYERMQEFYKTQVARLTEEVNHYKTLYHKLLIQQSAERKLTRKP